MDPVDRTSPSPRSRRRIRLIRPKLQLRLVFSFFGIAVLALVMQYLLFVRVLSESAVDSASLGVVMLDVVSGRLLLVLLVSFCALLPVTLVVGVLITHRLVGPITRFESYLKEVISGKTRVECRLRKGDELEKLCELINQATAPIREQGLGASARLRAEPAHEHGSQKRIA
jgi:hypothetical protein